MGLLGRFRRKRDQEVHSGIPVEGHPSVRQPTISEMVQQMVRRELSDRAVAQGFGSFDEEDDFDEEDAELMPLTPHQVDAMSRHELQEVATGYGVELVDGEVTPPEKAPQGEDSGKTEGKPAPAKAAPEAPQE